MTQMSQIIVQTEHLHLSYKNVRAVQDVSFSLKEGEILAVIGANGSGKTSTIECVEGLRKPDSGLVQVFGQDPWSHRRKVYRKIGIQLQETEYPAKIRSKNCADCMRASMIGPPTGKVCFPK